MYYATDVNGGTLYRSNGTTWTKVALGNSESAAPNGSAGGDPEVGREAAEALSGGIAGHRRPRERVAALHRIGLSTGFRFARGRPRWRSA